MKREQKFKTEAELCAAFIAWAEPQGVRCYAEWWGWDILVVFPDGQQLGIQAKLRLNADVIAQATPGRFDFELDTPGPDFRGILVPDYGRGALVGVAGFVGLVVFSGSRHGFAPDLAGRHDDLRSKRWAQPWVDWHPPRRYDLPPVATDAIAGSPCPVSLTPWKLGAIEVLAELAVKGTITTKRIREIGIDPRRWISAFWLLPAGAERRGEFVRGDRCPRFDEQHPTAYALALEKARKAAA